MEGKGCVRLLYSPAPADMRRFFRGGSSEPVSRFSMHAGMSGEEGLAGLASRFDVGSCASQILQVCHLIIYECYQNYNT